MTVLLNLEIELEPGRAANLPIIENSTPKELAAKFVSDYNLNESKIHPIAVYIKQQIQLLQHERNLDIFAEQNAHPAQSKAREKAKSEPENNVYGRLSKFMSPKYDAIDEDFEDFAPQKAVKFANPETFERLYNEAGEKQRKMAHSDPQPPRRCIAQSPDYIYKKYTQIQKERDEKLQQMRREKEVEELEKQQKMLTACSFKPGITEKGHNFRRDEDLYESLYKNTYINARIRETKQMVERLTTAEETFSPKINRDSKYYRRCTSQVERERKTREMGPYLAVELMPDEVRRLRGISMQQRMQCYQ